MDLNKMRDDVLESLRIKYKESPELLSDGAKAIMAILSTTKYMDLFDAKGDMFADMFRRVELAEQLLVEYENKTYKGPGDVSNMICQLIPIEMVETAEHYTHLNDLVPRMKKVLDRNICLGIREYEKANNLSPLDLSHPLDHLIKDKDLALIGDIDEDLLADDGEG